MSQFLEPMGESKTHYNGWRKPAKKDPKTQANQKLVRRRVQADMLALRDIEQQFKL